MSDQLAVVLKLRTQAVERAAKYLSEAEQQLSILQQQLSALENYALDYQQRLSAEGQIGVQQRQLLVAYLSQVQAAVLGQCEKISAADTRLTEAKSAWMEARLQQQAIEKLMDKRVEAEQRLANKREQNENDALNQVKFIADQQSKQ